VIARSTSWSAKAWCAVTRRSVHGAPDEIIFLLGTRT
jgi:hypothetical protein